MNDKEIKYYLIQYLKLHVLGLKYIPRDKITDEHCDKIKECIEWLEKLIDKD